MAILDLKAAHDTVPRDRLIKILQDRLSENLAKMIVHMLQPNIFETVEDRTETTATDDRGVPQGSPLSRVPYNVFMDTLAESIVQTSPEDGRPGSLFADDVILVSTTHSGLQALLNTVSEWPQSMDMTWSINKCHVLDRPHQKGQEPSAWPEESSREVLENPTWASHSQYKELDDTATLERV